MMRRHLIKRQNEKKKSVLVTLSAWIKKKNKLYQQITFKGTVNHENTDFLSSNVDPFLG